MGGAKGMQESTIVKTKEQTMKDLLKKINDDLFASKITNCELALYLGIAQSTLSSILNGKTEISFIYLVKIIMKLYDKSFVSMEEQMISDYLAFAKPENKREAFEYAAFQRQFDSLKKLIESEKNSPTIANKECAKVYDIIYTHFKVNEKYEPADFYDDLESCKNEITTNEMKILIGILMCQALYQMKEYKRLFKRITPIEIKVKKIFNNYKRDSYLARIKEGLIVTYMMQNKVDLARVICNDLLEICDKNPAFIIQKANSLYNIGESFLFESYSRAKFHLEQSLLILEKNFSEGDKDIERKKRRIKSTIIFLKIHHYRDLDTLPDILDDDDQAYLEFKRGNYQASESILLKMKETQGYLNEFQTLFLGLARNDRELIEISHRMFIEKKSFFYANLAKIYLG